MFQQSLRREPQFPQVLLWGDSKLRPLGILISSGLICIVLTSYALHTGGSMPVSVTNLKRSERGNYTGNQRNAEDTLHEMLACNKQHS